MRTQRVISGIYHDARYGRANRAQVRERKTLDKAGRAQLTAATDPNLRLRKACHRVETTAPRPWTPSVVTREALAQWAREMLNSK